jgi:hypothetical protein
MNFKASIGETASRVSPGALHDSVKGIEKPPVRTEVMSWRPYREST